MTLSPSTIIGGASPVHDRHASDFYRTPRECTVALIERHAWLVDGLVWEPACGDGAMTDVLAAYSSGTVLGSDIRSGTDFLASDIMGVDTIITNPPFNLAEEFIRHALDVAEVGVAMLLKATYWNAASRLSLWNEHPPTWVHPLTWRPNFAPDRGRSPTMDLLWTVWRKDDDWPCRFEPLVKPRGQ